VSQADRDVRSTVAEFELIADQGERDAAQRLRLPRTI
jgi:hypothetical protein